MAKRLRHFLYRDDTIVSQFLDQLQGGEYEAENIRQQASGGSSLGIGVHTGPLRGDAARNRTSSTESELNLRQTGPSRFARFYELASADESIEHFDACDEAIWDQLQVGEVIDVGVTLSIPDIVKTVGMVGRISSLMPIFTALSGFAGDGGEPVIDQREVASVTSRLPVIEQVASAFEEAEVPVIASLIGAEKFKVFVRLKRSCLLVEELQEVDGDARLVAKIQRLVPRGRAVEVGQVLPGLPSPNRSQRRQGRVPGEENALRLRYPGAVATPIAVFL